MSPVAQTTSDIFYHCKCGQMHFSYESAYRAHYIMGLAAGELSAFSQADWEYIKQAGVPTWGIILARA